MSRTVDQRVVEMQFDNKQFESGVSTTMSTLDKLKQKLNFSGASKGLEEVSASAKNVDMSGLSRGIENVSARFSALQVMGVTALANITNSAVNAGKRIASALTIAPIKTGFEEYETKIGAIQTIMSNTASKGTTLEDVTKVLNELNTYADKTIYNFAQMTKNVGTFTAAGIDLEESAAAIQGIANLAAASGSTSQQASTAMYQLSQALASGSVKLMDWNSVVNAGMGGEKFQEALKATARDHGIAVDKIIEKNGSFRQSLHEGWISADILNETLRKFTVDGAKEYSEAMVESGKWTREQADALMKEAQSMEDAATKVKTLTQLWETLKESAQSGWAQTWELIVGDFEEAKEFYTKVSDVVGGMLGDSAESRNKLLAGALTSSWDQLLSLGIHDEAGFTKTIADVLAEAGDPKVAKMIENTGKITDEVFKSGAINADTLSEAVSKLTKKYEGMSDAELESAGYTKEQVKALSELNEKIQNGTVSMEEFVETLGRPSGRQLLIDSLWNTFDAIMAVIAPVKEAFKEIFPPITAENIYNLIASIESFTEKLTIGSETADKIKRAFKGVFAVFDIGRKVIINVAKSIGDLIGSEGVGDFASMLLDAAASIGDFFVSLNESFDADGLSGVLSTITTGISDLLVGATDGIRGFSDFFSAVGDTITKVAGGIWTAVKTVFEWISNNVTAGDIFAGLAGGGIFAGGAGILAGGASIADMLIKWFGFGGNLGVIAQFKEILDGIADSLEAFTKSVTVASLVSIAVAIAILSASIRSISELDASQLTKSLISIGVMFGMLNLTLVAMTKTLGAFGTVGLVKAGASLMLVAGAVKILAGAMERIGGLSTGELLKGVIGIGAVLFALTSTLKSIGWTDVPLKSTVAIYVMAISLGKVADTLKKFGDMSWGAITRGLAAMGGALVELVASVSILGKFGGASSLWGSASIFIVTLGLSKIAESLKKFGEMSWGTIDRGLTAMGGAIIELGAVVGIVGKYSGFSSIFASGSILIITKGLSDIADALKEFGEMSWGEIGRGLVGMGGALGEIGTVVGILGKFAGFSSIFASGAILAVVQGLDDITNALMSIGEMSWDEVDRGLIGMAGSLGGIGAVVGILGKFVGFSSIFGSGAILMVVRGLSDITDALKEIGNMSWDEVDRGLIGMAGALGEIGAVVGILGKFVGFSSIIGSGAILIAIQGLGELADTFKIFGEMSWGEIAIGLVGMGGALLEVGAITGALGVIAGLPALIGGGVMLLAVQSLGELADAFKIFGEMSWGEVATGLVGMGGALLEVGVITGALGAIAGLPALIGGGAILVAVQGLGDLADALKKFGEMSWDEVKNGLVAMGGALGELAAGGFLNSFGILGDIGIAIVAESLGTLADSVKKWTGVTIPEGLAGQLSLLALAVGNWTFSGIGAGSIALSAAPLGTLADSVKNWTGVTVPDDLAAQLSALAAAVISWTFSGIGAASLSTAAGPVGELADSVKKWNGVTVPDTLTEDLGILADAVKEFSWSFMGGWSLGSISGPMGELADSVKKWDGVTIPEGLTEDLGVLADAIKEFSWAFLGGWSLGSVTGPLGELADSVSKWNGVAIPEGLGDNLKSLASAVESFANIADISIAASGVDKISSAISNLANTNFGSISSGLNDLTDSIKNLASIESISDSFSGLGDEIVNSIIAPIEKASGEFSDVGSSIIDSISDGIKLQQSVIDDGISDVMSRAIDAIDSEVDSFNTAGEDIANALSSGVSNEVGKVSDTFVDAVSSAISAITLKHSGFVSAGAYLGEGLVIGINSKITAVYNAAYALGQAAVNGELAGQDSASPSKAAIQAGHWMGEGLVIGMKDMISNVYHAGDALGKAATGNLSTAIRDLSAAINTDIDTQPTIRPVMDLSDVRTGADAIEGMFNKTALVGATANVGAINMMMNRRNQNGANADVVNELVRLGKKLDNVGGDSYSIGNVNYQEGSDVAEALETIIRHAIIERRS